MKKTFAVIGGGASGICFAYNVSKYLPDCEVKLIEAAGLAEGSAFALGSDERILNVAVESMSIDCFDPHHFSEWLRTSGYQQNEFHHWPYVGRNLYRHYLLECWENTQCTLIKNRATRILKIKDKVQVEFTDDTHLVADFVILATGHEKPQKLFNHDEIIDSLALDTSMINSEDHILVIGSALSAFDVFQIIKERPFKRCDFLSRRGQIPLPHLAQVAKLDLSHLRTFNLLELLKEFRLLSNHHHWQDMADAFKGHIEYIWPKLSVKEKGQFRRLLRPYWSAIRHRLPAGVLDEFKQDTRFQLLVGRVTSMTKDNFKFGVSIGRKGEIIEIKYDKIIQATGQAVSNQFSDLGEIENQVLRLGPALHQDFWETNSIPNIREQILRFILEHAPLQRGSI